MFVYRAERCFIDIEEAKACAEDDRKMGSGWKIRELPACAFIGERESLIVADAEVNPRRPLTYHKYASPCRPYLASIAAAFKMAWGSRVRMLTEQTAFSDGKRFSEWQSSTRGARYSLHWYRSSREEPSFDLSSIKNLINIHRESTRKAFWGLIRSEGGTGTEIQKLHPRSPLAGIQPGDIVTQVENLTQNALGLTLEAAIASANPGDLVSVKFQGKPEVSFQLQSFEDALKALE